MAPALCLGLIHAPPGSRSVGKKEACIDIYRTVVTKHAPHDPRLEKALHDAHDGQDDLPGLILRHAMNAVLKAAPAKETLPTAKPAPSHAQICADIRKAIHIGVPIW